MADMTELPSRRASTQPSIANDVAMLREMIRSSRPHSGSEEAHDAWDEAIDRAYATLDNLVEQLEAEREFADKFQDEVAELKEQLEASKAATQKWYDEAHTLHTAAVRARHELDQWVFADGSVAYRVERAEKILGDALKASSPASRPT